ncbi:magnesium chelatase subunit D [Methyloversatilis thermotolerans]|uniref:magnesium chelatase subunit D n=1 Tax=Methyloversatilis thermotolerans TaxID=1346290 RepID=UPI0003679327|nr:magnesium chelatase subunit D [Methyloversatilis thermotolerans]
MTSGERGVLAMLPAALAAVDPRGLGGVRLRARVGPARERWLAQWRALLAPDTPVRKVPLGVPDARLLGGLDIEATLTGGRPVGQRGLLAEADGGWLLLAMAERLRADSAARVAAALDSGSIALLRDGIEAVHDARVAVIALDEAEDDETGTPAVLAERLAFDVMLDPLRQADLPDLPFSAQDIAGAAQRLATVALDEDSLIDLAARAARLGVHNPRALLFAARAARAAAALDGRPAIAGDDIALAVRLVLQTRARLQSTDTAPRSADAATPPPVRDSDDARPESGAEGASGGDEDGQAVEAVGAALPENVFAGTPRARRSRIPPTGHGRSGEAAPLGPRGRPVCVRRGQPERGMRLSVIDTLRAAAPWQSLRQPAQGGARLVIDSDDFRIRLHKPRRRTTTIFVVDASGSTALQRLGEAKGAVELLLAECYARRDRVALIAFRGTAADLLLPPTRSLVRARRSLSSLPGGGGTPLAQGIEAGWLLADAVRRQGDSATLVLLTDGRGNVARDGQGGRQRAEHDALEAARRVRASLLHAVLIDTSPRPYPAARCLAERMGALYAPLPRADAHGISRLVREAGEYARAA